MDMEARLEHWSCEIEGENDELLSIPKACILCSKIPVLAA